MSLPNASSKLIGYFLLVLLKACCLGEGFDAENAHISEVSKGMVEVSDLGSDGSEDNLPPEVKIVKTQIATHSRILKQRTDGPQNEDEFECGLSSSERRRYFDDSTQQWLMTNEVLGELNNDVQAIVNCTSENDIVVFRSTRVIRAATTITLPWNLTLRANSSATFTCPRRGPLLVTRTPTVTLENLVIVDCNGTSSVIVLSPRCDSASSEGITQLDQLTFEDNGMFEEGHIVEANGQCLELSITGLVFRRNRCIGTHCVILGAKNTLMDIYLFNNQGSNETSLDSSIFFASNGSETTTTGVTSVDNGIRSFYASNCTLRVIDSRFDGNRRNISSRTRQTSIGGGVLFANHSSIFITNTTLQHNSAFNGGALFVWSSKVSVNECAFRENDALRGNGGALFGDYNSSFEISSSSFSKNRGYRGAALYSNYTTRVSLVNANVSENYCSRSGAVYIIRGVARIRLCLFQQNTAFEGAGALGTRTTDLFLLNSTFSGNVARFGGACSFEYDSMVRASTLLFENNVASQTDGGSILFLGGYMRIRDSLFRNNQASSDGGAIHTMWDCVTVLTGVVFSNNTSEDHAGALQIWRGSFSGSDLTFERNQAKNRGGAVSFYEATNVSLSSSHFEGNRAASAGAVHFYSTIAGYMDQCTFVANSGYHTGGGALYAVTSNVNISSSLFRANTASTDGSIALSRSSNSTILDSIFLDNNAEHHGGAVSVYFSSRLVLSNVSFASNQCNWNRTSNTELRVLIFIGNRGEGAGALLASSNSSIFGSGIDFVENYAVFGGCLQMTYFSIVRISTSLFWNNTSENAGGAIDTTENSQLLISNSTFLGNNGGDLGGGLRVWTNSTLELVNTRFYTNEARSGGALYLADFSIATASNCTFTGNIASNHGGAVGVENNSTITISNSTFLGNRAHRGGGFSVQDRCLASLLHSVFERNGAPRSGGAMFLQTSNVFLFSLRLDFNWAVVGGSLFAYRSSMAMRNSTIRRSVAYRDGGAIYLSETNATLQTTRLESNVARKAGGGIYAVSASHISASNIELVSNIAEAEGGGIALGSVSSLLCYSCMVLNNKAFSGAGIFVVSIDAIQIVAQFQNSRFQNNSAESYGGGIEFASSQNRSIGCSNPQVTCGHIVLLNTSFEDNYANHSGAIILTADPNMVLINCEETRRSQGFITESDMNLLKVLDPRQMCSSWRRNRVSSLDYGDVVGTYGQEIVLTIDPEHEIKLVGSTRTGYVLENVSSGRQLPTINVTILDGYGLGPAPTLPHSFQARLSSPDGLFNGLYPTTIDAGVGNFSRVIGLVQPGTYTLELVFDNEAFEAFNVTVIVRECIVGEEPTRDRLTCQECDDFSYNFNTSEVGGCKECPDEASCKGRYIVPNEGSWHNSPCHDQVKDCLVEDACKYQERQEILTNFTQNFTTCNMTNTTLEAYRDDLCNEGYEGPLCGSCQTSFGLSLLFRCLKCPHKILSFFIIVGVTLYLLATASFTIRGCLPFEIKKAKYKSRRIPSSETREASVRDPEINVEMVRMIVEGHVPRDYFENAQEASTSQTTETSVQQENACELTRWRTTEIFKIMINFLQTTAIAGSVNFNWTYGVNGLFEASEYIGAVASSAISGPVDCLVSSASKVTRAVSRILFSLFIPGIVMCFFAFLWGYLALRHGEDVTYFTRRTILSIIAVTYISYLGLTRMAVRAFYCVDVYDSVDPFVNTKTKYWAIDTSIECYERDHSGIIALDVLVLIVVTIAFPLISAVILFKNKEVHMRRDSWMFQTAGFLFRAFKESCLFWESMVMLRKACLSLIVVFSYPLGGLSQGTLAIVVLLTSLYTHLMIKPYRQDFQILNNLESTSLLVSCLTFTLGLFFENERCSESVRSLLSVVIIMANVLFFMFLCFMFFSSSISHLRVVLQYENVLLDDKAPWWIVLKTYITSRSQNPRN